MFAVHGNSLYADQVMHVVSNGTFHVVAVELKSFSSHPKIRALYVTDHQSHQPCQATPEHTSSRLKAYCIEFYTTMASAEKLTSSGIRWLRW